MSYLTLDTKISDCKKATISLWFRVPKEKIDEVTNEYKLWRNDDTGTVLQHKFMGVIPLMTFGSTNIVSRKFYYPTKDIGVDPGTQHWAWHDGPPAEACANAGWVDAGLYRPTPNFTTNYWSFEQLNDTTGGVGGGRLLDGSYIGIDCSGRYPALGVSIVMPVDNKADIQGSWPVPESRVWSGPWPNYNGAGFCGPPGGQEFPSSGPTQGRLCYVQTFSTHTQTDHQAGNADVTMGCCPETFRTIPAGRSNQAGVDSAFDIDDNPYGGIEITPDFWHHLLISFDFTGGVETHGNFFHVTYDNMVRAVTPSDDGDYSQHPGSRTKNACRMWIALDDVNKTSSDLSCYWPEPYADPNAILSVSGYAVARDAVYEVTEVNNPYDKCVGVNVSRITTADEPIYKFAPVGFEIGELGLPAVSEYTSFIRQVEVAEFQMWTDVSIDTGDVELRRLFIDDKGQPVVPDIDDQGQEVTPEVEKRLGKPAIRLHEDTDWQEGKNTGSLQLDFKRTGVINKFDPEPALGVSGPVEVEP